METSCKLNCIQLEHWHAILCGFFVSIAISEILNLQCSIHCQRLFLLMSVYGSNTCRIGFSEPKPFAPLLSPFNFLPISLSSLPLECRAVVSTVEQEGCIKMPCSFCFLSFPFSCLSPVLSLYPSQWLVLVILHLLSVVTPQVWSCQFLSCCKSDWYYPVILMHLCSSTVVSGLSLPICESFTFAVTIDVWCRCE